VDASTKHIPQNKHQKRCGCLTCLIVDVLTFLAMILAPLTINGGFQALFAVAIIPLALQQYKSEAGKIGR
jgi:hypothetical protein